MNATIPIPQTRCMMSRALLLGTLLFLPFALCAQQPLLYLPLDGSLDNRGSIGGTAQLFAADGAAPPEFVSGYRDEALSFTSESAVALPFELDQARFPRVTITAWVREEPGASGTRAVLATGSSAGARMQVGGQLAARAGHTGVSFDEPMPVGEWVFVASVVDTAAGWARLHQNDSIYRRDGLTPGSKPPRKVRAPDDPDAEPLAWLTVGAATLSNWQQTTRAVAIDEVRLYTEALSEEQVEAIRTAGAPAPAESTPSTLPVTARSLPISMPCDSSADCATGSYCAQDRTCHPDSHRPVTAADGKGTTLEQMQRRSADRTAGVISDVDAGSPTDVLPDGPATTPGDTTNTDAVRDRVNEEMAGKRPIDIKYESEEAAIEAQERREAAAAAAAEAQSDGEQRDYRTGFDAAILRFTGVSGDAGDYSERIVFDNRELLLKGMTTNETNDKPCHVILRAGREAVRQFITADGEWKTDRFYRHGFSVLAPSSHAIDVCDEGLPAIRIVPVENDNVFDTDLAGPITGIQVCTRGDNKRVKGLRARVREIRDPPDSRYAGSYQTRVLLERTNCNNWHPWQQCPANTYAIGAQLYFKDGGSKFVAERDFLSGVALVCSGVEWVEIPSDGTP